VKHVVILGLSVLVLSCGGEVGETPEPIVEQPVAVAAVVDAGAAHAVAQAADAGAGAEADAAVMSGEKGRKLLETERVLFDDKLIEHDATGLPDAEKEMLNHLLSAARLIDEIHMLQLNPENPAGHWPADLSYADYSGLGRQINGKELLSPFTVVRRDGKGKLVAVPYAADELLGPRMRQVADELRAASRKAPDRTLASFLRSRAGAFAAETAYPYDASDYAWIGVRGDWEVTVGPYETYRDARRTKAFFEMYVGRVDEGTTMELKRLEDDRQAVEEALIALVGPETYRGRKLDPRISIRAVDVWMASGDGRRAGGAAVAVHLPNRGPAADEGLYKKLLMVNHNAALGQATEAGARLLLDEAQIPFVDARAGVVNAALGEFSRGLGASSEMKVTNPMGKETTVREALKEHDPVIEEAKAASLGLWLVSFQRGNGWIGEDEARKRYATAMVHALSMLQYPLSEPAPRAAAILLGWCLAEGALAWDAGKGRWTVDFDRAPAAAESLARKVATIQCTGDHAQAGALVGAHIDEADDGGDRLAGVLEDARQVMTARFGEAGIRSPSLRYRVVL